MLRKRHVLFTIADRWRVDKLGVVDYPCVQTLALDARGVTFHRH